MIALIASLDVDIDLRLQNTSAAPALSHNLFFRSVRKNRIKFRFNFNIELCLIFLFAIRLSIEILNHNMSEVIV